MREIKFRGVIAYGKREWVYGAYCHEEHQAIVFFQKGKISVNAVMPETVGQFSGIRDKNGTEIYEGDIVERDYGEDDPRPPRRDVVKWVSGGLCLWNSSYTVGHYSNLRVIGNIHNNPEMLEAVCTR